MVTYFHSQVPQLVKSGLMGYFWVTPLDPSEPDPAMQGKLYGEWIAPKLSTEQVKDILAPMEEHMKAATWGDPVRTFSAGQEYADFIKGFALQNQAESAGLPIRLGSRLLDEKALSKPLPELKNALRKASGESVGWPMLGHVVAGPGTWEPKGGIAAGSNAVSPAWRKTCMQIGKSSYLYSLTK